MVHQTIFQIHKRIEDVKSKIEFYSDDIKTMSSKEYSAFMIKIMSIKSIQKTPSTGEKMTPQKDDKSITTNPMRMKYQSFKQFIAGNDGEVDSTAVLPIPTKDSQKNESE